MKRQLPLCSSGIGSSGGSAGGCDSVPYQVLHTVGVTSADTGPTRQRAPSPSTSENSSTLAALSVVRQCALPLESRSWCAISYAHHTHGREVSGAAVAAGPAGSARPVSFT